MLALAVCATRPAAAEPDSYSFAWVRTDGADTCPGSRAAQEEVTRRLGRSPFDAEAVQSLEVVVARDEAAFRATIYIRGPEGSELGQRSIESQSDDCATLFDATVLALALVIDPEASEGPPTTSFPEVAPAPPPVPAPACPSAPAAECPTVIAHQQPAPPTSPWKTTLAPQALLGFGLIPDASVGWGLEGLVQHERGWGLALALAALPSREATSREARLGAGLTLGWAELSFAPWKSRVGSLRLGLGLAPGLLHVVAYSPQPVEPGDFAWFAGTAGLAGQLRLGGPLVGVAGFRAFVPVTRYSLEVDETPLYFAPAVAGMGALGLGLTFP